MCPIHNGDYNDHNSNGVDSYLCGPMICDTNDFYTNYYQNKNKLGSLSNINQFNPFKNIGGSYHYAKPQDYPYTVDYDISQINGTYWFDIVFIKPRLKINTSYDILECKLIK